MIAIFWRFLCWLDGCHIPRRRNFLCKMSGKWQYVTRIKCRCGNTDVFTEMADHTRRI